ncbi:AraC family transcriptional regulator [Myroides sp. DF42-4-2]|uniref:helix-turn-helix domain-containing protein n=1 Tax=unclassified Myroides TaxID=2642485 RepID=UPI0025764CDC|nr:AraC family transcriptional regulator [Myroides sp. DF42-4-2]MDM1407123.1 helix-turn-helix transcriptional regulator [Myroides sp. DF42-4-2]
MIWLFVCYVVYAFFYWLNGDTNKQRANVFRFCSAIFGLNVVLYLVDYYGYSDRSSSFLALLFLLQGAGLVYLLKIKRIKQFVHCVVVVLLVLFYVFQLLLDETSVAWIFLRYEVILLISVLSFVYGCYGYWCLIGGRVSSGLKQYIAFYIVTLFCVSISFMIAYLYRFPLFSYLNFLFYFTGLSLLFIAFLNELKEFVYAKFSLSRSRITGQMEREASSLFGAMALDVSIPNKEKMSIWSTQYGIRSDVFQLDRTSVGEKESIECRTHEIRQVMTAKLIESRLFLDPVLNLEQLTIILGFPKAELLEFFKESSSLTFKQYINRLRVEYAILMIKDNEENYTVEELSLLCGFNTRLSFYRAFVEVFGFAPSEIMS